MTVRLTNHGARRSRFGGANRRRAGIVVGAVLALVILIAGAAAYWLGGGGGQVSVRLSDAQPLALTAGTVSATLVPGGGSDIAVVASNPNPFAVEIDELARNTALGTSGFAVDSGHSGCDPGSLAFVLDTNGNAGWTVPPKTGTVDGSLLITLDDKLSMNANAASACQGATFTVYLKAVDLGPSS
jgi:hypothetical protein